MSSFSTQHSLEHHGSPPMEKAGLILHHHLNPAFSLTFHDDLLADSTALEVRASQASVLLSSAITAFQDRPQGMAFIIFPHATPDYHDYLLRRSALFPGRSAIRGAAC